MRKYFLTGLVTLLPLAITIWVVHFFVNFLTKPFLGVVTLFTGKLPFIPPKVLIAISQILILIALFCLIFFIGLVARRFFFHQLISIGDKILFKIPLINKVYKTSKEIVVALFSPTEKSFKQVVLLPFPYKGAYCLGLITSKAPKTCSDSDEERVSIFIPTTPNPSTGFLVMNKRSDLIFLDMKAEDAVKYVVSCAVIQPEKGE